MRTKTLLVAAAALAAGVIASQAQSSNVYSANVVGYVNLTVKPGYNLLTAQLVDTANPTGPINPILTNSADLPDGSTFFAWNDGAQDFTPAANWVSGAGGGPAWYNSDYSELAADIAPRGTSFFVWNSGSTDCTITLVGEVPQGTNTASVVPAYGFLADFVPASQEIKTNGFPIATGSTLQTFDPVAQDYAVALNGVGPADGGPDWYNSDYSEVVNYAPPVGGGFLYFNPNTVADAWIRVFTVK
jgi:hypothetical protein